MNDDIVLKKDEVIEMLLHRVDAMEVQLDSLEPGSTEYSRLASDIAKISDLCMSQYNKENDSDLKYEEIRRKYMSETTRNTIAGVSAATGVAGLIIYRKNWLELLHFEQTGAIVSSAGKSLIQSLGKILPFVR